MPTTNHWKSLYIKFSQLIPKQQCQGYFENPKNDNTDNMILTSTSSLIIFVLITIVYFGILIKIWQWRGRQAVNFKSPIMIILGGICLWADSVVNIFINDKVFQNPNSQNEYICATSIITTFTFHYIAYFCLIFRASRIFKIMELENKHLD